MKEKDKILAKVLLAKKGDRKAFDFLIDHYYTKVCCYIDSIIRNYSVASELTQDTFLTAYNNIHKLENIDVFKFWLLRIARNKCLDYNKSPRRKEEASDQELIIPHDGESRRLQITEIVKIVLNKLNLEEKELILLVDYQEFSYQEAGEMLGISTNNIKSKLHRARQRFIEEYSTLKVDFTGIINPKKFDPDGNNNVA